MHYALKNGFYGAEYMAEEYNKNPDTDFHKIVANMAKITRTQAKTINLDYFMAWEKVN